MFVDLVLLTTLLERSMLQQKLRMSLREKFMQGLQLDENTMEIKIPFDSPIMIPLSGEVNDKEDNDKQSTLSSFKTDSCNARFGMILGGQRLDPAGGTTRAA